MSSEIMKFYKTFDERLKEYSLILSRNHSSILSPLQVSCAWSNYLELCLTLTGWNALWYILRKSCDDLHISFPKVVEVKVNDINFQNLTAAVVVISCEDDEEESDELPHVIEDVPLKDLYVTIDQENSGLDVANIAECLDQLRVFYHHLWWPWDDDAEYEQFDWVSCHLEYRLKLYFDKLLGKVHYVTGKTIKQLMESGQETHQKLKNLCDKLSDLNDDEFFYHTESIAEMNECHNKLESIKSKLRLWEIPELRKSENTKIEEENSKPGAFIVVKECNLLNVEKYLLEAQQFLPLDCIIKSIDINLEESVLNYNNRDVILLTSGIHELTTREYFDFTITLKGLHEPKPSISDKRSNWCFFESLGNNIVVENVAFDLRYSRAVFFVKRGTISLNSVTLESFTEGKAKAIFVYNNATLVANQCVFSKFKEAIVCMGGSTVRLQNCTFENNDVCLKIFKGANVSLNNCDMSHTINVPVKYEGSELPETESYESFDYLTKIENFRYNSIQFANELKSVQLI